MSRLDELGSAVASAQDAELASLVERVRLAGPPRLERPRARRPAKRALAVAALLGLVFAGAALWRWAQRPLSMEGATLGAWTAAGAEPRAVSFGDGSTILFAAGSRFQISTLTHRGALVVLEQGTAAVSVTHRSGSRWLFRAGPFDTEVVGTRFDLSWRLPTEAFDLVMYDGLVRVSGPTLAAPRNVVAGERLARVLKPSPPARPQPVAPVPVRPKREAPSPAPEESWRALADEGRYLEAWQAAQALGVEHLSITRNVSDLSRLADLARLAGQPDGGLLLNQAIRRRFPKSAGAAAAGFWLGRLAFDADDDRSAIEWFERYAVEAPGGPFAREALGRLLETQQRAGLVNEARQTAKAYLADYPVGPHARIAQSVLRQ